MVDTIDIKRASALLAGFDLRKLFIEVLGWSNPPSAAPLKLQSASATPIAEAGSAYIFEVLPDDLTIPPSQRERSAIAGELITRFPNAALIFIDEQRRNLCVHWRKREDGKSVPREHHYHRGQATDAMIQKLAQLHIAYSELNLLGEIDVLSAGEKLRRALDTAPVVKKFYAEYKEQHFAFAELIKGITDPKDRSAYASVLLHRLMFIWFLQKKGFLHSDRKKARGDTDYLLTLLKRAKTSGKDRYYKDALTPLFFEAFAEPEKNRSPRTLEVTGKIPYLNGGLFLPHRIEKRYEKTLAVPDAAFEALFALFGKYHWHLDDTPQGSGDDISPDILGFIFEKYINQKQFGAYYTPPSITEYLCEHTIGQVILDRVNDPPEAKSLGKKKLIRFESLSDLIAHLDDNLARALLIDHLPKTRLLDPACGSGAFLLAALKRLLVVYSAAVGHAELSKDPTLKKWLADEKRKHKSLRYSIHRRIITDNLYGVDIMEEAVETAKLRLFLALVACAANEDELEPLPNIDFNLMAGNSLIGQLRVDEQAFNQALPQSELSGQKRLIKEDRHANMFQPGFKQIVVEKEEAIRRYRQHGENSTLLGTSQSEREGLAHLRRLIQERRVADQPLLDALVLAEFQELKVKHATPTWDAKKRKPGKPVKRAVEFADVQALQPFHWGYEFYSIFKDAGGFDAIITNPPWEALKPQGKEFFADHSELVTKKSMRIEDFEKLKTEMIAGSPEILKAWHEYQARFSYQSGYFLAAADYPNQSSQYQDPTTGKSRKTGSDLNLYKLFTERCMALLHPKGHCGIVIPSGIYTDLGAKGLREMLFSQSRVTGLFCIENRQKVFEIDSRFKFVVLTFEKGGTTERFPAAFMRHDPMELDTFPRQGAISIEIDTVRKLSPDSLSVTEFKSDLDVAIANKLSRFPLLGERMPDTWNIKLGTEFHMTNDSDLFLGVPTKGSLPFFEGKMLGQFEWASAPNTRWVDEKAGRERCGAHESKQMLAYQGYRLAIRRIARPTDARTLISAIAPPRVWLAESVHYSELPESSPSEGLLVAALFNSLLLEAIVRQRTSANFSKYFVYQLPVPRLGMQEKAFKPIVDRSARLVCYAPEFADLWKQAMGRVWKSSDGASPHTESGKRERAKLRAELDAIVAHVYGLTEHEFAHILAQFPIVARESPEALSDAMKAYRDPAIRKLALG